MVKQSSIFKFFSTFGWISFLLLDSFCFAYYITFNKLRFLGLFFFFIGLACIIISDSFRDKTIIKKDLFNDYEKAMKYKEYLENNKYKGE